MQTRPSVVLAKAVELSEAEPVRSLSKWMVRHHDELLAHFVSESLGRPDWKAFVIALAENGIKRQSGKPIDPGTAARTWLRVKKNVRDARAGKVKVSKRALELNEIAPGVVGVAPRPAITNAGPPTNADRTVNEDSATETIAKLRADMNKRSGR